MNNILGLSTGETLDNYTLLFLDHFIKSKYQPVTPLDKLNVLKYSYILKRANKIKRQDNEYGSCIPKRVDIEEYFFVEDTIASALSLKLMHERDRDIIKDIMKKIKNECKIINEKINSIKIGSYDYETNNTLKDRLEGYLDEEEIEDRIELRKEFDNIYYRHLYAQKLLKELSLEMANNEEIIDDTPKCKIYDFKTGKRIQ